MKLLIIFIVLNIANVIIQTVKSLATVKCGKTVAAITNAVAYGLYTIVVVYMMCDLPLFVKAGVIALCNLVGVFIVKWIEEKSRKDKLWKVEATVLPYDKHKIESACSDFQIPYNYIDIHNYILFNFYCENQKDSKLIKDILSHCHAKYFVSESKEL